MSSTSRKETERIKLIQEKCQTLLTQMLRDEDNKYCVDCDAKGPRWASWNLGVFLCIRCAGIHRNLGVHISRVKSVNLDTWTPEQVISLQQMGNSRARAVYEAQLPDGFRRPQTDTALESFIRAKYEHKKYLAREWLPPSPPKVDWGKEIDEELEKQKRKKKAAQANTALGIGIISGASGDRKLTATTAALPAPLPKPMSYNSNSPKIQRNSNLGGNLNQSNDLLGLSSPTKALPVGGVAGATLDFHNDSFTSFLSASPIVAAVDKKTENNISTHNTDQNSLAREEENFFNQYSLKDVLSVSDKDKSGKLTKDSILALYGAAPPMPNIIHNRHGNFGQLPQPMLGGTGTFTGMAPNYVGVAHPQQAQFMTPPNSVSMYNTPVMTAPAAFTSPGIGMNMGVVACGTGFGAQFPVQGINGTAGQGYTQQITNRMNIMPGPRTIMATGQNITSVNMNLMQSNNQNFFSSIAMPGGGGGVAASPMIQPQLDGVGINNIPLGGDIGATTFQTTNTGSTTNLNKQFGNLNISNVWQ